MGTIAKIDGVEVVGGSVDPASDYIARYRLDAGSAADDTGTYDGTWVGPDPVDLNLIDGVIGTAVQFGVAAYTKRAFTCGAQLIPSTGDFTVTFWEKTAVLAQTYYLICQWTSGAAGRLTLNRASPNKIQLYTDSTLRIDVTDPSSADTWQNFALRRSGNDFSIWIDGVSKGSATLALTVLADTTKICNDPDNINGAGSALDDIRFYTRALSEAELLALAAYTA